MLAIYTIVLYHSTSLKSWNLNVSRSCGMCQVQIDTAIVDNIAYLCIGTAQHYSVVTLHKWWLIGIYIIQLIQLQSHINYHYLLLVWFLAYCPPISIFKFITSSIFKEISFLILDTKNVRSWADCCIWCFCS